jgi:hypothetical protein
MPMTFPNLPLDTKNDIEVATIEIQFSYPDGSPLQGTAYTLTLSTGGTRQGKLDGNGKLKESQLPHGATASVQLQGVPLLALAAS